MKKSNVTEFENKRWREGDQVFVFRHAQALEMVEKGQKVLDISCGDGLLMSALSQKGAVVSGVDISEEGVKKCREKGLDVSVVDITTESLPFEDSTFDTVIMLDILEHLYAPEKLLEEAARVSKKNIIISVPNFNSLPARLQVLFGKVPENNRPNKGHIYWFNRDVLGSMLHTCGFTSDTVESNTFFEHMPIIGTITRFLAVMIPSVLSLSFIVKAKKN